MDFFNTRSSESNRRSFVTPNFFVVEFLSKSLHFEEGGGVNGNLEKVYILNYFFAPFSKLILYKLVICI